MKQNVPFFRNLLALVLVLMLALGLGIFALAGETKGSLSPEDISGLVDTTTDADQITSPYLEVARTAKESVVGVNNYQMSGASIYEFDFSRPFEMPRGESRERVAGTGSGTVISPYGHVLTNHHVIEKASRLSVSFGESELDAYLVGQDANLDIAVLLVPGLDLPAVPLGDSDAIQVGEYAIVIGNPLGQSFERSVTVGVVSAVARDWDNQRRDQYGLRSRSKNQMIQVDAAISSGNSGGGMFNTLGQLQGIPTLKLLSSQGGFFSSGGTSVDNIGMCVPINVAKPLIREVLENYQPGQVPQQESAQQDDPAQAAARPRMGIRGGTLASNFFPIVQGLLPQGAYVSQVEKNSPAEVAGLLAGDIIVEAAGQTIQMFSQLQEQVAKLNEGDYIELKVYRVEGLVDAMADTSLFEDLPEGQYLDVKVQLLMLDNTQM